MEFKKYGEDYMRILMIDDDRSFLDKLEPMVISAFKTIISNVSVSTISTQFSDNINIDDFDIFLIDIHLNDSHTNGLKIASRIRQVSEEKIIVFISSKTGLMHRSLEVQPLYFVRKAHLEADLDKLVLIVNRRLSKKFMMTVFDYNGRRMSLFHNDVLYAESFGHHYSKW